MNGIKEKYWKDSYELTCPYCGYSQRTKPSIAHKMGMFEHGHGKCSRCDRRMRIHFDYDTETMLGVKE